MGFDGPQRENPSSTTEATNKKAKANPRAVRERWRAGKEMRNDRGLPFPRRRTTVKSSDALGFFCFSPIFKWIALFLRYAKKKG